MKVALDLVRLGKFKRALRGRTREVHAALDDWDKYYRQFTIKRFRRNSRGLGDWKPLAESTIAAKKRKYGGRVAKLILQATKRLISNLAPERVGYRNVKIPGTLKLKIAFDSPIEYPNSDATVSEVAAYHQSGGARLPRRRIFVPPDDETKERMAKRMKRALVAQDKRRNK